MKTPHILLAALAATLVAAGGPRMAHALDTDIYLKAQAIARDDAPNVLLIFDNSGSMNEKVTSRPPYDPAIDYCAHDLDTLTGIVGANAGKPPDCATIAGRVYFSFFSSPPWIGSEDWVSASKNYCFDSVSALGSSGFYGGAKIARWELGDGWGTLAFRNDGDVTYLDCEADGSSDGLSVGDGQFPRNHHQHAYTNSTNQTFLWSNYTWATSPTLYHANYLSYFYNDNLKTERTRIDIAQEAVKDLIDGNKAVRFGLMTFNRNEDSTDNHGGRVIVGIAPMTDAQRAGLKDAVDDLVPDGNTPLSETMWEAYRYFGGLSVDYGDNNPSATPARDTSTSVEENGVYVSPLAYQCQKAYIIYFTDGDPTEDHHADSNIGTRVGHDCDGESCLDDLAGWMRDNDVYEGLPGSQKVATYTIGFGSGISNDGLALLKETATQGGGQYYAAGDADELAAALQGALTQVLVQNTSFTSPSLSVNAFNRLHNRDDVYFALFKPSNSCNWDGNVKKYRLCTHADMENGTCDRLSDILDQTPQEIIDANSKIVDDAWSYWTSSVSNPDGPEVTRGGAGENVPDADLRDLYTYYGVYTGLSAATPGDVIPVQGALSPNTNAFYDAVVADPTLLGLPTGSTSTAVDTLIRWMRGVDSYDKNLNGSTTDARWSFGDALHSRPVAVTYGAVQEADGTLDYDDPIIKLFVGTNDGVVRMINDQTGEEEWAFLPKELYGIQYELSQEADTAHPYGLDNTPSFWTKDADQDGIIEPSDGDKVYMYVAMRRGGRNIYAFDVTPTTTMTSQSHTLTPKLMWVIEGGTGEYTRLGQTWSRPLITRIRFDCGGQASCNDGNELTDDSESRIALVFAGGYDPNQDNAIPAGPDAVGNAIYIVDAETGGLIWWASSDSNATLVLSRMKYSIPSDLALMDSDGDGSTDRLYVGDMSGQIWRVDLGTQIADGSNGGSAGYVFADVGCTGGTRSDECALTGPQDRRKFFYPPDVAQVHDSIYSSTAKYDLVTIGSGDREDPLDLLTTNLITGSREAVHNRVYAFRDYHIETGVPVDADGTPVVPGPLDESDLYDATGNAIATATGITLDTEIAELRSSKGWFIDLEASTAVTVPNGLTTTWIGEKVLARTAIFNGQLFVTTFTPANDTNATTTCSANEGVAKQYVLNVFNAVGEGDFDEDGDTERSAQIGGGIPSEVVIIFRPDGTSGLIGTSGGATAAVGNFSNAARRTFWYQE